VMILEEACTGDMLYNTVTAILDDKARLEKMSHIQKSLSVRDAAKVIIDIVLDNR